MPFVLRVLQDDAPASSPKPNDEDNSFSLPKVHIVTEEDIVSSKFSIEDVVLPIPGHSVTYSDLTKAKYVLQSSRVFSLCLWSDLNEADRDKNFSERGIRDRDSDVMQ